ncbi:hypothetical protein MSG28_008899 [Choristoneura fumiferana]|uniref:Uncharacterized protein n=1 Tax=Choristoneura fumiferana TaxID=7141 RepID=A0ACC0J8F8_CHOFU|nr:hypothetical protein MSG28_008899 [Choristoneura fumiferana]
MMIFFPIKNKDRSNAELLQALGIPDNDLLSSFAYIKSTLKSIRGATLNVANKIYIKNCAELNPGVKKDYEEIFESSIEHIDFSLQGATANAINNWGVWEKPFDTRLDTRSLFHTSHTTTKVILMRIPKTWFKYGVSLELNARLKFEGGEASMVIVLPDEADGLDAMIQKLGSGHNIMADIETLRNTELEVMMPRFKGRTASQLNLVSHLLKLGIRSIFDERKSEVNMLTTNEDLYGSNAGQNTLIQIRSSYGFLTSTLKAVKGATLNVANKVYLKKGGELKPGIEKDAKNVFQSSLDQLDFNESEAAAATINNWLLRMKYQGGQASMVIVLPDEVEGLRSVLQKLASGHNIMTDIETMRPTELDIMVPKFKVETTMDLKKLLPNYADIDMLKSNEKLFVSDAIQKALIIVDEQGTEAAACTECLVEMVMAMLALGCKEKSNAEILRTLGIPDDDVLLASFAYIKSTLKSIRGATLNVANKIYIKNCAELKPGVKKDYEEIFESSIEHIDFSVQGAAANAIKNWFREQTNSNTSLGAVLDDNTRLVLVNVIYFQLNFEGGEASMVIVLPDEAVGLDAMIQKLDSGHNIMADIETLRNTELEVMMPRFDEQTTSHLNLVSLLLKELGTDKTSICSPLSAEILLALLALGCKNQSHDELLKALDIPDDESIRSSFSFLKSKLQSIEGATLNVANRVYLQMGSELNPGIKKDAEEVFESSLEQLDFTENVAAASAINKWVAEKTNDKITNMVSPDMLDNETRMVLVNAMYFQGSWEKPFPERSTRARPFHINNTTTVNVPQMAMNNQTFNYGISEELKARLLQIKYEGDEASMVIVLPDEVEGLSSVLQKLASGHNIMDDIEKMSPKNYLDIVIPKFKVETTIDLKDLLPKLGIKSIFNKKTSEIYMLASSEENAGLFVYKAIQKSFIVVDEKGTEAGCCFSMFMKLVSKRPNKNFIADRPFLYLLIAHRIPLFIGVFKGSEYAQISSPSVP